MTNQTANTTNTKQDNYAVTDTQKNILTVSTYTSRQQASLFA